MSRSDLTDGFGMVEWLVSLGRLGLGVGKMRLGNFLILFGPIVLLLSSCSNSVKLSASDRSLVSPVHVNDEVGLPEKIYYVEPEGGDLKLSESGDFGREMLHGSLGERADKGAVVLLDEFTEALKEGGFVLVETRDLSQMELHITDLGLFPLANGDSVQFQMEVDALLSDPSGRVIWRTSRSSVPHSDHLPSRSIEAYKAEKSLVNEDFTVVCRLISEELVKDLESQME